MEHVKNVLVLAPHTDDAELGCGGTIARFVEEGISITVAAFSTARESLPPGAKPDALRIEFREAMLTLGISEKSQVVYDYTVRKLSYSRQEVLEALIELRHKTKPQMVLLPSGSDVHQDHQVLHNEGLRAFKDITVWGYELPWNHITFSAQAFVTLEQRHLDKKWEAMQAYESQIAKGLPYFTPEFMGSLARIRGVQVKTKFAEAFEVIRVKW